MHSYDECYGALRSMIVRLLLGSSRPPVREKMLSNLWHGTQGLQNRTPT